MDVLLIKKRCFPQVQVVFFTCQPKDKQAFTQIKIHANIQVRKKKIPSHPQMHIQLMMDTSHFGGELSAFCVANRQNI